MIRKFNGKKNISGELIEKYRNAKHMTREDLAKQLQLIGLNMDRTHIFRIEKNQLMLKDFELIAIGKILGVNYKELEKEIKEK